MPQELFLCRLIKFTFCLMYKQKCKKIKDLFRLNLYIPVICSFSQYLWFDVLVVK